MEEQFALQSRHANDGVDLSLGGQGVQDARYCHAFRCAFEPEPTTDEAPTRPHEAWPSDRNLDQVFIGEGESRSGIWDDGEFLAEALNVAPHPRARNFTVSTEEGTASNDAVVRIGALGHLFG